MKKFKKEEFSEEEDENEYEESEDDEDIKDEEVEKIIENKKIKSNYYIKLELNPSKENPKFFNTQRTLIFCSRGIDSQIRHLMNDLKTLLPHSKSEMKFNLKNELQEINTITKMLNCHNCLYFESRGKKQNDVYLYLNKSQTGPTVKFRLSNIHTMDELKMTGNCLKGI
jgi:ribosome biogenesis protein BRX1